MAFLPNECFQTLKKEAEMIIGMRAESKIKRRSETLAMVAGMCQRGGTCPPRFLDFGTCLGSVGLNPLICSEGIEPNPASRPRGPVVCTYIFGGVYFDESIGKTQEFTVHSMYLGILKVQIYIMKNSKLWNFCTQIHFLWISKAMF